MKSEETKKKSLKNFVLVEGYLKEVDLKLANYSGNQSIRGSIIIAVDKQNAHKVDVFISEKTSKGVENGNYTNLLPFVNGGVLSITEYLNANPTATFETAMPNVTKVKATGSFEEFVSKDKDERDVDFIKIQCGKIEIVDTSKVAFAPKAVFDLGVYIQSITPEISGEQETGRLNLVGITQNFKGELKVIPFKVAKSVQIKDDKGAVKEVQIASYVSANCGETQTMSFKGRLVNTAIVTETEREAFGEAPSTVKETKFVKERLITGGYGTPIDEDNPGALSIDNVRQGLIDRAQLREDNYAKAQTKKTENAGNTDGFGSDFNSGFEKKETKNDNIVQGQEKLANQDIEFNEDDF